MDSINGIPIRWGAVEDNALLGGLLSNTAGQVGNLQGIAATTGSGSLFKDSPFGEDWDNDGSNKKYAEDKALTNDK